MRDEVSSLNIKKKEDEDEDEVEVEVENKKKSDLNPRSDYLNHTRRMEG